MANVANSGSFKKGQVANPRGRPKRDLDLAVMARQFTGESIKTIVAAMRSRDAPWNVRVAAAGALLDRGYGRAPQTINLSNSVKLHFNLSGVSRQEQVEWSRRLMALRYVRPVNQLSAESDPCNLDAAVAMPEIGPEPSPYDSLPIDEESEISEVL